MAPGITPPPQSVQTEHGTECHCWRHWLPQCRQSSPINILKWAKVRVLHFDGAVCTVVVQSGQTKESQPIQLKRGLRIVDSPGVAHRAYTLNDSG